jgi:hypothetical protein
VLSEGKLASNSSAAALLLLLRYFCCCALRYFSCCCAAVGTLCWEKVQLIVLIVRLVGIPVYDRM